MNNLGMQPGRDYLDETDQTSGLVHLLEHCVLFRGTATAGLLLTPEPYIEVPGCLRNDPDPHHPMPHAAERIAGAQVDPRQLKGQPQVVRVAGNHIDLLSHRWDPEAVDDVSGFEPDKQASV